MSDTDYQLFLIERFGDKVAGTRLKTFHYIRRTVQRCQKDDWNIRCIGIGFETLRYFKAA